MAAMRVRVTVEMSVDWADEELGQLMDKNDPYHQRVVDSVEDAVRNALVSARNDGFTHDMEDDLSLDVGRVDAMAID